MENKDFNKYLITLGVVIIAAGFLFVGYNFLSSTATKIQTPSSAKTITIQWNILELPQLKTLHQFSSITLTNQIEGRDDPLMETVKQTTE